MLCPFQDIVLINDAHFDNIGTNNAAQIAGEEICIKLTSDS